MQNSRPNRYSREAAVESPDPIVTPSPVRHRLGRIVRSAVAAATGSTVTIAALAAGGMIGSSKTRQQPEPTSSPTSSSAPLVNTVSRNLKPMASKLQSSDFIVEGHAYELDYWMGTVGYAFSDGVANSVQVEGTLNNLDASGKKTMRPDSQGPALYVAPVEFLGTSSTATDMSLATVFNSCNVIEPGQQFESTRNNGSIDCATVDKLAPGSYDVALKVKSLDDPQKVYKEVVTRVTLEASLTGP